MDGCKCLNNKKKTREFSSDYSIFNDMCEVCTVEYYISMQIDTFPEIEYIRDCIDKMH